MPPSFQRFPLARIALLAFASLSAAVAHGQVVIGAARMTPLPAVSDQPASTPKTGQPGSLAKIDSMFGKQGPLFRWGSLVVHSNTGYTFIRSDGLLRVPGQPLNTTQHTLSEALDFDLGSTWTLSTNFSYTTYSNKALVDTTDSSVSISGRWTVGEWRLAAAHQFAGNNPIVAETGGQNSERTNSTTLSATRDLFDRTQIQLSANQSVHRADSRFKNSLWTGSDWTGTGFSAALQYRATSRLTFSGSYGYGYDAISANPDISHYSVRGNVGWKLGNKWSVAAGGGRDYRSVRETNGVKSETPIYDASLSYSPTVVTTFSLVATRIISTAYFNDQTIVNQTWSANVSQRLLGIVFLTAGYTEGRSKYSANLRTVAFRRADQFDSSNVGLSTVFGQRGSISIGYRLSRNNSGDRLFRFDTHSLDANLGYRF